jgi:glycine betaine/proline transport system ATP-binding protein
MQDEFMRLQSVLKKTIVFITHDFDEAIRLADRIAIMKDGAIVQAGTPEDLVLSPATEYVAEFTRNVPRAKVVKVGSLMKPAPAGLNGAAVPVSAKVAEVAPRFEPGSDLLRVEDADGRTAGALHRADVVDLMMRG